MNRRAQYDQVDWTQPTSQIAQQLGVSTSTVNAARRVRGIQSHQGHGGHRKGAGVKPKSS
jgi:hypothetical protein